MSVERNTDRGNKDHLSAKASAVYQTEIHTEANYSLDGDDYSVRREDEPVMLRVDDIGENIAFVMANDAMGTRASAYATLSAEEARALGGALVKAAEVKEEHDDD